MSDMDTQVEVELMILGEGVPRGHYERLRVRVDPDHLANVVQWLTRRKEVATVR
jgi:hypothetical protein